MKFLVDAQLPRRLAIWLCQQGHDALHTLDLPSGNTTSDRDVAERADRDGRIVGTKDSDFVKSYLVNDSPRCLLLVSTGNISNRDLDQILERHLTSIERAFEDHRFVELQPLLLVQHE